jgi:predicted HicB family RNase H-like nuclease
MNFEGNATTSWTATPADTRTESPGGKKITNKPLDEAGEKLAAEMKVFNDVASELKASMDANASYDARVQALTAAAAELFGLAPTWTAFYREILGADGLMKLCVCTGDEMAAFECSAEQSKLLEMLTVLRSRDLPENDPHEQQRMITVRIPKSLHDSICEEANELAVSVNKLCISRLLQKVDKKMIPTSSQKRRGRRPGTVSTKGNEPETGDEFS